MFYNENTLHSSKQSLTPNYKVYPTVQQINSNYDVYPTVQQGELPYYPPFSHEK